MMYGWGWGGAPLMEFLTVLFWALVFYFVFRLARSGSCGMRRGQDETPLDILKKRYARGEIDKEEFDRRKRDLES
jgi:putative membrane protein